MHTSVAKLLLGATFAFSLLGSGVADAQDANVNANADPYPYCQALEIPSANSQGVTTAPGVTAASPGSPAGSQSAPVASSATLGIASGPAKPDLATLLKSTTDPNKIVDTMLDASAPFGAGDYDALFQSIVSQVSEHYVDTSKLAIIASYAGQLSGKIKSREDLDRAISGLAKVLGDPVVSYLSAPEKLALELRGSIENIAFFGVLLKQQSDGSFVVDSIVPESTAALAGFRAGDIIVSVNDQPLKGLSKNDAEALEMQPTGNQLKVASIQDGNNVTDTYMLQQALDYNSTAGVQSLSVNGGAVGYIKLPTQISDDDLQTIMQGLVKLQVTTTGGVDGLVLDLRYVNSFSVQSIGTVLPLLMSQGVIYHEQLRQGQLLSDTAVSITPVPDFIKAQYTPAQQQVLGALTTMPLVVLVNASTTAAGAEQLAEALREGRPNTTIVGEQTHGIGEEATVVQLPNCGILTIATSRYLTPSGAYLGGVGVTPDVVIASARIQSESGDAQLSGAVQLVVSKAAYRPLNLVHMSAPFISQLGPPPPQERPADDVDWQRIARVHKSLIERGLAVAILFMVAAIYWIATGGGPGGGSTSSPRAPSRARGRLRASAIVRPTISITSTQSAAATALVSSSTSRVTESTMKNKQSGFFSHIAFRSALGALVLFGSLGGLYKFAQSRGGIVAPAGAGFHYLTESNAPRLLHFKQGPNGALTAQVDKPVLIVECGEETCNDSALDLASVTADLKGKVTVLALNPYHDTKFTNSFEMNFVGPEVVEGIEIPLAQSYLAQQNQPFNIDTFNAALQQPDFKNAVLSAVNQTGLLRPIYPRFLLYSAGHMQLVQAAPGLANKDEIEVFVTGALNALATADATGATSGTSTAPAGTPGGASPAQPGGNP